MTIIVISCSSGSNNKYKEDKEIARKKAESMNCVFYDYKDFRFKTSYERDAAMKKLLPCRMYLRNYIWSDIKAQVSDTLDWNYILKPIKEYEAFSIPAMGSLYIGLNKAQTNFFLNQNMVIVSPLIVYVYGYTDGGSLIGELVEVMDYPETKTNPNDLFN